MMTADILTPRRPERPILFKYPKLWFPECLLYHVVWFCISLGAWYKCYEVSVGLNTKLYYSFRPSTYPWPLAGMIRDTANYEFEQWLPFAFTIIPWLIGHNLLFNLTERPLGRLWQPFMLVYWFVACSFIVSPAIVLVTMVQAFVIYGGCRVGRHWTSVWGPAGLFLYHVVHNGVWYANLGNSAFLATMIFLTYKLLQFISFCLEDLKVDKSEKTGFLEGFYKMIWYAFYLPYLVSVVRIYPTFVREMQERHVRPRNNRFAVWFAARIAFWLCVDVIVPHFFYFNTIMLDHEELGVVSLWQLVCIGYVSGLYFHMKYVVIFGLPCVFARFDNMDPPRGPACVARVALYSKVWRAFDRGLYDFFREYIFVPICRPTFALHRKIIGYVMAYAFVILWHAYSYAHAVWIGLNVVEIFIELAGKWIYKDWGLMSLKKSYLSDRMFRRVLAWLQILPMCFGLYGIFYFLGGHKSGWVFVDRVFWQETWTLHLFFFQLIGIGYFYVNCCIDATILEDGWDEKKRLEEAIWRVDDVGKSTVSGKSDSKKKK